MTISSEHKEIAARMTELERKLDALISTVNNMREDVAETKEIVAAWRSVKLWAQFAKWLAGFVAASAAAFAVLKGYWHR